MTTSTPATRFLRIRIGRVVVRACLLWVTPPDLPTSCRERVSVFQYAGDMPRLYHPSVRVLIVEDEPFMADAIRDGFRPEAIAADIASDGEAALKLPRVNAHRIAPLHPAIPGPSGGAIAKRIRAS